MSVSRLPPRPGAYLWVLVLGLALAGCGGSTGSTGATGAPGTPGAPGAPATVAITSATALTATITGVTINSAPVVDFTLKDENGNAVTGLTSDGVRFTIAKLVPSTNGDSSHWQNYINRVRTGGSNGDQIQATNDRGGTLVDHGDGSYTYTFVNDITNVTSPIVVKYEPTLTHRVGMQIDGPIANAVYTWQPSTGATTGITTRDIVATDSCNQCHGKLTHHRYRDDTRYCVTCHNPGSSGSEGVTVDFKVMIHKIHDAAPSSGTDNGLPSVANGVPYVINGRDDFSDVVWPQDIRHCTKCHDPSNPETPDANDYLTHPTMQACGSCHDDVNFSTTQDGVPNAWNIGHPGGVQTDNSACSTCHKSTPTAGLPDIVTVHEIPIEAAEAKFKYTITKVVNTAPGQTPQVTFKVTDPTNNDAPYNILTDPAFTQSSTSRLYIDIGWNTTDYTNTDPTGPEGAASQALSFDALASPTDNGDGTYTATSTAPIPATATGSGVAGLEGHPAADLDGSGAYATEVPVQAALYYFPITDATATPRRQVVDIAKCDKCHRLLSLHGSNRTNEPGLCVICHNHNDTDISQRPASGAIDGKKEVSIDFKRMIHEIHGADFRTTPFIVYGYGGNSHDFSDVGFPGILNNCETCHLSGTYEPPLQDGVGGSAVDTGTDPKDPSDNSYITPTAAACSACHDDSTSQAHMETSGLAQFDVLQDGSDYAVGAGDTEICQVCHSSGAVADVKVVHNVP